MDNMVSIIMPVKNTESYLEECMNSILAQTYEDWELIAIDDGSSDATPAILQDFATRDNRMTVLQSPGNGIIDALQHGYKRANGAYITRMDADDIMLPDKLESLVGSLIVQGRGHVAVGCVEYFAEGELGDGYRRYAEWLNELTICETNWTDIYRECVIPSPCWMVYRVDFDACGGFENDIYPEDYDLCFRFYKAGYQIAGVNRVLHCWRDYSNRTSRTHEHYADNRFLDLKMKYFLDLDYNPDVPLVLWGAGKKGKWIARYLIDRDVEFDWITNNEKKIGREIYGEKLACPDLIARARELEVIMAVANANDQINIANRIENSVQKFKINLFS